MVIRRGPDETDAEYLGRLAEPESTELRIGMARRAIEFLDMSLTLARQGGFDADGFEGWKKRSAFVYGIQSGLALARLVMSLPAVGSRAAAVLDEFLARVPDTMRPIAQADIDAVCPAADVIVETLKPAIEALR